MFKFLSDKMPFLIDLTEKNSSDTGDNILNAPRLYLFNYVFVHNVS